METATIQLNDTVLVEEEQTTKNNFVNAFNSATFNGGWYLHWLNPPYYYEQRQFLKLPERLTNPLYGRNELDAKLQKLAAGAPGIKRIWEITKNLPSLTQFLIDDRNNE